METLERNQKISQPLRILYLVFNETGKGTFWRAYYIGVELAKMGHEVTVLTSQPKSPLPSIGALGAKIHVIESPAIFKALQGSGWDPYEVLWRNKWIKKRQYDIIHSFETRPVNLYPTKLAEGSGAGVVFDWADWFGKGGSIEERPNPVMKILYRPLETYFENRFRNMPAGTTVINSFLAARAKAMGFSEDKIYLLWNGCNALESPLSISSARNETGLPKDVPIIGFVGRTFEKDAVLLANSFNRLNSRLPDAKLLLVGYFNRDIEEKILHHENVIRTGLLKTEDVHTALAACSLFWLPLNKIGANYGRFPIKFNDYMSAGRPIIASDIGDMGAIIKDKNIGTVVPPDPEGFAKATFSLLKDPKQIDTYGRNAYNAAKTDFSWSRVTEGLLNFYQDSVLVL